jgi:hypothetical protein
VASYNPKESGDDEDFTFKEFHDKREAIKDFSDRKVLQT